MRAERGRDAFGEALLDQLEGRARHEIIERSDGFVDLASRGPGVYFAEAADWPRHEQDLVALARGRCLDIGCGAGRVLLELQRRRLEAVGIDVSPLALEVCRRRGARDVRQLSIDRIGPELGRFDTMIMLGNNFGLFGNPARAKRLLERFARMTSPEARILAEVLDPYRTREPLHLAYHEQNRERGRMPGQLRIRVRYKASRTPWYDYLFVSRDEMAEITAGTGWHVARVLESGAASYGAVLEKD